MGNRVMGIIGRCRWLYIRAHQGSSPIGGNVSHDRIQGIPSLRVQADWMYVRVVKVIVYVYGYRRGSIFAGVFQHFLSADIPNQLRWKQICLHLISFVGETCLLMHWDERTIPSYLLAGRDNSYSFVHAAPYYCCCEWNHSYFPSNSMHPLTSSAS